MIKVLDKIGGDVLVRMDIKYLDALFDIEKGLINTDATDEDEKAFDEAVKTKKIRNLLTSLSNKL